MSNIIIIVILLAVLFVGIRSTRKHLKGQGSCCGGGHTVVIHRKELEGKKKGEFIVKIEGMHCDHCALSVTKAINSVQGASANVELKQNRAVVSYDREISREEIKKLVEAQGFTVTGIEG